MDGARRLRNKNPPNLRNPEEPAIPGSFFWLVRKGMVLESLLLLNFSNTGKLHLIGFYTAIQGMSVGRQVNTGSTDLIRSMRT